MKSATSKINWLAIAALILSLPTGYFILIALLKYGLNISGPFDSATPFLEKMGIKQSIGWNINLLILFGPLLGVGLTILQVLKIKWGFTKEEFQFHFTIQKRWFPILVAAFSIGLLAILFFYMLGENCSC